MMYGNNGQAEESTLEQLKQACKSQSSNELSMQVKAFCSINAIAQVADASSEEIQQGETRLVWDQYSENDKSEAAFDVSGDSAMRRMARDIKDDGENDIYLERRIGNVAVGISDKTSGSKFVLGLEVKLGGSAR